MPHPSQLRRTILWRAIPVLPVMILTGCTLYENCATYYQRQYSQGQSMTEACSRGVVYRSTVSTRRLAEMNCATNFTFQDLRDACYYGIDLFEEGRQGAVIQRGLDMPATGAGKAPGKQYRTP